MDPATAPLAEIGGSVRSIQDRYEREEEQRLVSEVLEKAAMGRPAALGLESCLRAAPVAAIKPLLVEEAKQFVEFDRVGAFGEQPEPGREEGRGARVVSTSLSAVRRYSRTRPLMADAER